MYENNAQCYSRSSLDKVSRKPLCIWLFAGRDAGDFGPLCQKLYEYHHAGGAIFILGENHPYFEHANHLLDRIFPSEGIQLEEDHTGSGIMSADDGDGTKPGTFRKEHMVTYGLMRLFEGETICHLNKLGPLKSVAAYNDGSGYTGRTFCASADRDVYLKCKVKGDPAKRGRILIDGGWTKFWDSNINKAGVERYAGNATGWLISGA